MAVRWGRRSVVTRLVACLVVAGLTLSALMTALEWRRAETRLRLSLAATIGQVTQDLQQILPLINTARTDTRQVVEEVLRLHTDGRPVVGIHYKPRNGELVQWGYWPYRDEPSHRVNVPREGALARDTFPLDRLLIIDQQLRPGSLTLVLDAPGALAAEHRRLLERLAVQWLLVAVLALLTTLLMRRWVGEPLSDLSRLLTGSANADALSSLALAQSGPMGALTDSTSDLIRRPEDKNRALALQERQFVDLFERSPMPMICYGPDGIITHANAAAETIVSEGPCALPGRPICDLVQVEDHSLLDEIASRVRLGETARCRMRFRTGMNSSNTQVALEATGVVNRDGRVESTRLCIFHVSDSVQTNDRLDQAQALRVLVDHVPEAVLLTNQQGRVLAANRPMLALLRRDQDLVQRGARVQEPDFWDGLNASDPAAWGVRVRNAAATPDLPMRERLPAVGGTLFVRASPVHDPTTGMRGQLWLVEDGAAIEERDRLHEQQKRLLSALRAMGAALRDARNADALMERSVLELRRILGVEMIGMGVRSQHTSRRTQQVVLPTGGSMLLSSGGALVDAVAREILPRLAVQQELLHWPDLHAPETLWAGGFRAAGLTSLAACPITSGIQMHGVVWIAQRGGEKLNHASLDLLEMLCPLLAVRLHTAQLSERLQGLHMVDAVTELPTILQFERAMHTYGSAPNAPLSIIVLDLDGFGRLNAEHGRSGGDAVLRQVAARLVASNRNNCFVARFAGAAFGVIIPKTGREQAALIAERLRAAVANGAVTLPNGGCLRVTASVGVAGSPEDDARVDELLDLALIRVGAANRTGMNRVVSQDPVPLLNAG